MWLRNIFLTLIAAGTLSLLGKWLLIGSVIICIVRAIRHLDREPLAAYFFEEACAIDELANVHGGPVWNLIFFKRGSKPRVKFGSRKVTMSMVFGVNIPENTLNKFAKACIWIFVELWDRGHMKRAEQNYYLLFPTHGFN